MEDFEQSSGINFYFKKGIHGCYIHFVLPLYQITKNFLCLKHYLSVLWLEVFMAQLFALLKLSWEIEAPFWGFWGWVHFQAHSGCWQNLVPSTRGTKVLISLLAPSWGPPLAPGDLSVILSPSLLHLRTSNKVRSPTLLHHFSHLSPVYCIFLISAGEGFPLFKIVFMFDCALGLHCCTRAFSSCCERGLLSSWSAQAYSWGGFSCCRAQALDHGLSICGAWA